MIHGANDARSTSDCLLGEQAVGPDPAGNRYPPADEDFGWVFDVPWLQGLTELRLAANVPEKLGPHTAHARAAFQKAIALGRIVIADLAGATSLDLTWLPRYLAVCDRHGVTEVHLHGFARNQPLTVRRAPDGVVELSLTHWAAPAELFDGVPGARLRLRCSPALPLAPLMARFAERGCQVEAIHDEAVRMAQFKVRVAKKDRRLVLDAGYAHFAMPAPETVEGLRRQHLDSLTPKSAEKLVLMEIRVQVADVRLGPSLGVWLDWIEGQTCALAFHNTWGTSSIVCGEDGLSATLQVRHLGHGEGLVADLDHVPAGPLARLTVSTLHPLQPAERAALARITRTIDVLTR